MTQPRDIELLAPAANAQTAIEAILHGADAIYIGGPTHGARYKASNSTEDIKRVVEFAHPFGVKVYVTVNTILYDSELADVEKMIRELYIAGVDALIVQDMGVLRLDIPPIALHASTQCDTRTPEKALFLQKAGFSQIVLARELSLKEIREIHDRVSVPLECFVHGALCVSFSGCCHASQTAFGRSANRGECSQVCRLPFTLTDASGRILARDKHLLSLKDFNASPRLEELLSAGVSSLKIEGRLKETEYVKNVVAYYRQSLDKIIAENPDRYRRASFGESQISFTPQLDKSFNRGFTRYFLDGPRPKDISSPLTPKSMGETITDVSQLHNGDGISFFNARNEYEGVMVNGIKGKSIIGNRHFRLPAGAKIHRTLDIQWQKALSRPTAKRSLWLDVTLNANSLHGVDERGVEATVSLDFELAPAKSQKSLRETFDKFGNTIYRLRNFNINLDFNPFIPASILAEGRRRLLEALQSASKATYRFDHRRPENPEAQFPLRRLDFHANVSNEAARRFYAEHGVEEIEDALEIQKRANIGKSGNRGKGKDSKEISVMTTRHCILRELGCCLRFNKDKAATLKFPLTMTSANLKYQLDFDCRNCNMHLIDLTKSTK